MRWGSKGSLSVEIAGSKKGFWFSHEGGEGSDLLGLIRHVKACRFPDAVEWASRHTGIVPDDDGWEPQAARPAGRSQAETDAAREAETAQAEAEQAQRIALACRIAAGCIPLAGTLGERYLKQARGIPAPAAGWPEAIRWHPGNRALVAVATAADDSVDAQSIAELINQLEQDLRKATPDQFSSQPTFAEASAAMAAWVSQNTEILTQGVQLFGAVIRAAIAGLPTAPLVSAPQKTSNVVPLTPMGTAQVRLDKT